MKNLLLALFAGFALASGPAFAADMPLKAPAPRPAAYSWTGCYLDAGGGYGFWNQDHYIEATAAPGVALTTTTTDGGRGWLGRFGGGCDYQVGSILNGAVVVGAFGDVDAASLKGTLNEPALGIAGNETETGAWAVGGRIGYAVTPSMLWYFDGGYTEARFGQVNFFGTILPAAPAGIDIPSTTYHGYFLGSGTDTSLASLLPGLPPGLFLRSEFRYSSYTARDDTLVGFTTLAEHVTPNVETVTTALVWRFNWAAPVAARY